MTASPAVLVLDLGLTNCKALVYSEEGRVLGQSAVSYTTYHPEIGYAEQDPEEWWVAVCQAVRDVLRLGDDLAGRIVSISVTGHMHALVGLDRSGQPLTRAIILGDRRSIDSARWMAAEMGPSAIYAITGARMEEAMPAAKIHWLKSHVPDVFRSVDLFTGCKDFVRGRMTGGDHLTDPIDACAMSLYDLHSVGWSDDMVSLAGTTIDHLPEICPPTGCAGALVPEAAQALGLPTGVPVVVGSGDDVEVLGAGLIAHGGSLEHLGTTGSFLTCTSAPVFDPAMSLEVYPHVDPDLWVLGGSITSAGAALAWAAELLGYDDVPGVFGADVDIVSVISGSPLIFVPHLAGERCPNWNPQVRGLWLGLSDVHSRADLMRAAFEGTAHALNSILKRIDSLVGQQSDVYVVHRQDESTDWLQLRANAYGHPLTVLNTQEPTALGAMILGAVGAGMYADLRQAVETVTGCQQVIEPDAASQTMFAHQSILYEQVQAALVPIWQSMDDMNRNVGS